MDVAAPDNLPTPAGFPVGGFDRIDTPRPMFGPVGEDEINKGSLATERPSLLGAAFRTENIIGSYMASTSKDVPNDMDPTFNAWDAVKGSPYEKHWDRLKGVFNGARMNAVMRDIHREEEDRKALDASPILGTIAEIGASALDVTSLLPGGAVAREATGAMSIGRTALRMGTAAAVGTAVQEAALQTSQQTRTLTDSAVEVAGSAVLGGMLGAAGARFLDRGQWSAQAKKVDQVMKEASGSEGRLAEFEAGAREAANTNMPLADAGAAVTPRLETGDLEISGKAARAVGKATGWMNPALRLAQSESPAVRELSEKLLKNSVYLTMHDEARTLGVAAETAMIEHMGAYGRAIQSMDAIYADARKAGMQLTEEDFRRATGRALRRGDVADPNDAGLWAPVKRMKGETEDAFRTRIEGASDAVSRSAQTWRQIAFDPLKDQAIAMKLLPEDVSVETAASYFSRLWRREQLVAQEGEFKRIVSDHYGQTLKAEFERDAKALRTQLDEVAAKAASPDTAAKAERAFYSKWEVQHLGEGVDVRTGARADFSEAARSIADQVFDKLTGRDIDATPGGMNIIVKARGPLKERTFNVPDALVEPFLEDDVSHVGRRYTRIMGADVELARNFQGDPTLKKSLAEVKDSYDALRTGVSDEARLRALAKAQKNDIGDIEAIRDMLRGTTTAEHASQSFDRIVRVANQMNYLRLMGGVVVASLNDVVRVPMVHGLQSLGFGPLAARLGSDLKKEAIKLSVKEAQLAGNVLEKVHNSRLASMIDVTDPYRTKSAAEAYLEKATDIASRWNGIRGWTDTMKSWASVVTQNRVLEGVERYAELPATEKRYLAFLGIDARMADRMRAQYAEHGTTTEGVKVAGSAGWTDEAARRTFFGAINKDVDSIIVQPSRGDLPLFASTPLGRMSLQFKSFTLASNQRILMRGLQEDQTRFWGGVVASTAIGMMISLIKAFESNRQKQLSDNPGYWLGEGIDRGGIPAVLMEISNTAEKLNLYGVKKGMVDLGEIMFPGVSGKEGPSRYSSRGKMSSLFGPTVGMAEDLGTILTIPESLTREGKVTDQQRTAIKNSIPFNTYRGMKELLSYVVLPPEGQERHLPFMGN